MDDEQERAEPAAEDGSRLVNGFVIEQILRAGCGAIFAAWTETFDSWFAQPGAIRMNPNVGEPYWFDVVHDGERHAHYGRFLALEPARLIEQTRVVGKFGTVGAETLLTVELEATASNTRVRLTPGGFYDEAGSKGTLIRGHRFFIILTRCCRARAEARRAGDLGQIRFCVDGLITAPVLALGSGPEFGGQPFDVEDGDRERGVPAAPEQRRYLFAEVHADARVLVRAEGEPVVGEREPGPNCSPPPVVAGDVRIFDVLKWRLELEQPEPREERTPGQRHAVTFRSKTAGQEQREVALVHFVLELLWHWPGLLPAGRDATGQENWPLAW